MIEEAPVLYEEASVVYQETPNEVITLPALPTSLETPIPGVIGQSYHGKFKRSKKQFGLFKPKAPYYLEDASGDRVAWIEVKDIVVPGSIKAFIDQDVVIHGERNRYKKDWMIQARNMRLK